MTIKLKEMIMKLIAKFRKQRKITGYSADSCCAMRRPSRLINEQIK